MSAYIVGNVHISAMMQAAKGLYPSDEAFYWWNERQHYFNPDSQEIGQKLVDENFRSVNCRYDHDWPPDTYIYSLLRFYTPVEILKACNCYEYQCCETDDWKETEAFAIVRALKERAIQMLPGYNNVQWNIIE